MTAWRYLTRQYVDALQLEIVAAKLPRRGAVVHAPDTLPRPDAQRYTLGVRHAGHMYVLDGPGPGFIRLAPLFPRR